jgi:tRNA U34 5-carboxymethylaminomethyl modifying GTPase MnmE/TrmE
VNEVSLLTPPGSGAIAVVRVRGPAGLARLAELAVEPLPPVGVLRLARLRSREGDLDEAILVRRGPEEIEVHLTASPPLVEEALELLGATEPPGRVARTLEEQAEELLPAAVCEAGARILLDQAEGALSKELSRLLSLDEKEFPGALAELLERGRRASHALAPRRVVLAGPVNAGKSTLFNVLLGQERVLVAAEPGTTRDAIVEPAMFGEWPVELIDSAGERELSPEADHAEVEARGQALAQRLALAADLVLWLAPRGVGRPSDELARHAHLVVLASMADLEGGAAVGPLALSARAWPERARESVHAVHRSAFSLPLHAWEPGTAVPFLREQHDALVALSGVDRATRRRRLESLRAGSIEEFPTPG